MEFFRVTLVLVAAGGLAIGAPRAIAQEAEGKPEAAAQPDAAQPAAANTDAVQAGDGSVSTAESNGAVEAVAPSGGKKPPETLWEMIVAGGALNLAFMAVLGLLSMMAATVLLERCFNMTRNKILPREFVTSLNELVASAEQRREPFAELCKRSPSPIANVLEAGLLRVGRPMQEIEKSMEDAAARNLAAMRARIRPLSVIANVAPLLGLLGTVVGMLFAFRTASQAGLGKAELLAEGIYLALETTVAGLVIAIPALMAAAVLNSRAERFLREMDERLMNVMPAVSRIESEPAEKAVVPRQARPNPLLRESASVAT